MKAKAKKDGRMKSDGLNEKGRIFCKKDVTYVYEVEEWPEEEGGDYYHVIDELTEPLAKYHGMDTEFFNEYFEEIK